MPTADGQPTLARHPDTKETLKLDSLGEATIAILLTVPRSMSDLYELELRADDVALEPVLASIRETAASAPEGLSPDSLDAHRFLSIRFRVRPVATARTLRVMVVAGDGAHSNSINFRIVRPVRRFFSLTIGINDYSAPALSSLDFAENDAQSFHELCKTEALVRGGTAEVLLGPRGDALTILRKLRAIAKQAAPEDTVVFYFSGHGDGADGIGYLLVTNTEYGNYRESAVSLNAVRDTLRESRALTRIVLLDSCRSGMLKGARGRSTMPTVSFEGTGVALFLACGPDQYAYEDEFAKHGFFTSYVLMGMRGRADLNKDGRVSLSELATFLLDANNLDASVQRRWPGATQRPSISLSANSSVPFVTQSAIDLRSLLHELRIPDGLEWGYILPALVSEAVSVGLESSLEGIVLSTLTDPRKKVAALVPLYVQVRAREQSDGEIVADRLELPAELGNTEDSCWSALSEALESAALGGDTRSVEVALEALLALDPGLSRLRRDTDLVVDALLSWPGTTVTFLLSTLRPGVADWLRSPLAFRARIGAPSAERLSATLKEIGRESGLPDEVKQAYVLLACESWARGFYRANIKDHLQQCSPAGLASRLRNDTTAVWVRVLNEFTSDPERAGTFAETVLTAEYDAVPARKRVYSESDLGNLLTLFTAIRDAEKKWFAARVVAEALSSTARRAPGKERLLDLVCQSYASVTDSFLSKSSATGRLLGSHGETARLRALISDQAVTRDRRFALLLGGAAGLRARKKSAKAAIAMVDEASALLPAVKPLYGSSVVQSLANAWIGAGRVDKARRLLLDESFGTQHGARDRHAVEWKILDATYRKEPSTLPSVCRRVFLDPPPVEGRPARSDQFTRPMQIAYETLRAFIRKRGVSSALELVQECGQPLLVLAGVQAICAEDGTIDSLRARASVGAALVRVISSIPDSALRDNGAGKVIAWAVRHQLWAVCLGVLRLISDPGIRQEAGASAIAKVRRAT